MVYSRGAAAALTNGCPTGIISFCAACSALLLPPAAASMLRPAARQWNVCHLEQVLYIIHLGALDRATFFLLTIMVIPLPLNQGQLLLSFQWNWNIGDDFWATSLVNINLMRKADVQVDLMKDFVIWWIRMHFFVKMLWCTCPIWLLLN